MNVSSITESIKTRLSSTLGSGWGEINYSRNIEKNNNKGTANKYGVNPLGAEEVDSQTRWITLDHEFEVVLTESYINTAMSEANEQTAVQNVLDKTLNCYKDFISTRLNNSNVIHIHSFQCGEAETNEDSKYITVRFTFQVRYRTNF